MAKIKKIKLPNNSVYDLVDYRIPGVDTEVTSGSNNLITSGAVQNALNSIVVPESMKYKGTVGTGGTITTLPAAATNNSGDTYKVITDGTYQSISAKIGDVFISNGETWTLIPSGDEPSGTVTNIATGTGLTGGPITTTGTISIDTDVVAMKSEIPSAVTESTVAGWGFTKNTGTLTSETDPVFSASAAAGISSGDISNWNNKVSNVQSDWNATSGLAQILNKPTIPAAVTESTVSGWGFTKNAGTITGVGSVTSGNVTVDSTPTTNSTNLVTSGGVKSALSGYLPLTGGTLTGLLRISSDNDAKIILDNTDNETDYQQIVFSQNGTEYARLGTFGDTNLKWQIGDAGYKIWHAGNDGSGSGLDADTVDGKHDGDLTARTCGSRGAFGNENATVADCKAWLAQMFSDSALGVGDNCYVGSSFIVNWNDDTAVYDPSSVHSFIKLGGGYYGVNYGQWLLSSYGLERIGYVGRNGNQWTDIKWLANTDDINSCAKLASPNNLVHSGNEFTIIPPNFSNNLWFNYRTSDLTTSGNVTGYYFGDGAGHALAYIAAGDMYVNNTRLAKITEIPTSLTTAEIDAIITAEDS